jgi:DNA-directed RNA polymerase subunit RPC12/RpoP
MATIIFKCPHCGGPFECTEGDRGAVCRFCGVTSVISGNSGVNRLLIRERIDLNDARTAVRKLLAAEVSDRESVASFSFKEGSLLFLPFWRLRGMATGWQWREKETFREEVDYDENGTRFTRTVKGPNERTFSLVAKPLDFSTPAGEYSPFGQIRAGLAAAVLKCEAMDYLQAAARGTVVDPLKGVNQARQEALAISRGGLDSEVTVRQEARVRISSEWLALTYYPVWRLLFTRGGRVYPVTIDAVNCDVIKCQFPGEEQRERFLPLALIALIILGWTTTPIGGVALTVLAVYLLKWRTGTLDVSSVFKLLAGTSERSVGVQRG